MRRGFTLIEVLIVVAIVGILAAVAIPNLMQAIERKGGHGRTHRITDKVERLEFGRTVYYLIAEDGKGCEVGLSAYSRASVGATYACLWTEIH